MVGSLAMFLIMRIAVLITFNKTAEETGADIEAIHTTYEANPVFKSLLRLKMFNYLFQFLIIPAIGFTLYFTYRRKVLTGKAELDILQHHVTFLFFLTLMNFVNDTASLVGRIL